MCVPPAGVFLLAADPPRVYISWESGAPFDLPEELSCCRRPIERARSPRWMHYAFEEETK
jgi:hypothetical protein